MAFEELRSAALAAASAWTGPAAAPARRPARRSVVRPPGAVEEARFLELCTRCDDCIRACPELVIRKAGRELGAGWEGTPVVIPAENPCVLCDGLPCVAACAPRALRPPAFGRGRLGLAVVDAERCYMGRGQPCDYCVKACPTVPKAIAVGERGRAAVVRPDVCTGCGECAQLCPANALVIEALP